MIVQPPAKLRRLLLLLFSFSFTLISAVFYGTAASATIRRPRSAHLPTAQKGRKAAQAHPITRGTSHVSSRNISHSRRSSRTTNHRTPSGRHTSRQPSASHVTTNPVERLDIISNLSFSLAHGSSAISYPSALDTFYQALADHQNDPSSTLRVLQFGDSHTAADMFTGEARRVFQGQFGDGGIGFSYPGHPFAGYRIYGSQRSQSSGWTTLGTHFLELGDAKLGLSGLALSTYTPGQWVSLNASCSILEFDFLRQPGGGTVSLADNGTVVANIDTSGATMEAGTFHYDCPSTDISDEHHFLITTESSAPVRLFGTTTLRPGVTWEAMGLNGAQAPLILDWYQPIFTSYLAKTNASLIVLAYGTNEAAAPHWTYQTYNEAFGHIVDLIHATLPDTAILVLGPADRSTSGRRGGFAPFGGTEHIVEAQRDVCRTHHCAFWNTQRRMGGFGSMQRWVYAGWAQHDHTHFNGEGYRVLADALLADLLSGYDNYRAAHELGPAPVLKTGSLPVIPITLPH